MGWAWPLAYQHHLHPRLPLPFPLSPLALFLFSLFPPFSSPLFPPFSFPFSPLSLVFFPLCPPRRPPCRSSKDLRHLHHPHWHLRPSPWLLCRPCFRQRLHHQCHHQLHQLHLHLLLPSLWVSLRPFPQSFLQPCPWVSQLLGHQARQPHHSSQLRPWPLASALLRRQAR